MKLAELRLGNIISGKGNSIPQVLTWSLFERVRLIPHAFKGVLLTEEWMIEFGFEKGSDIIGECWAINNCNENEFIVYLEDNDFCYYDGGRTLIIRYLHQLQNLHFALIEEELICNKNV